MRAVCWVSRAAGTLRLVVRTLPGCGGTGLAGIGQLADVVGRWNPNLGGGDPVLSWTSSSRRPAVYGPSVTPDRLTTLAASRRSALPMPVTLLLPTGAVLLGSHVLPRAFACQPLP